VQTEAIAHSVEHRAHKHLRFGVLPCDAAHVPASPGLREPVFASGIWPGFPGLQSSTFLHEIIYKGKGGQVSRENLPVSSKSLNSPMKCPFPASFPCCIPYSQKMCTLSCSHALRALPSLRLWHSWHYAAPKPGGGGSRRSCSLMALLLSSILHLRPIRVAARYRVNVTVPATALAPLPLSVP
jgi:hypothetical protein